MEEIRSTYEISSKRKKLSSWQFIVLGYLAVILIGSFLLSLPISNRNGEWTAYIDAFFTSVSATCVTGLAVFDTYLYWNLFGQIVILLMVQIGGIGFMTIISLFAMLINKHIGIYERKVIMQSSGNLRFSGLIKLIRRIILGTTLFELVGTIILSTSFIPRFGLAKGIYFALFHAVSAFCNAGFDLMGESGSFSSLSSFASDPVVLLTTAALIFLGGIGFLAWSNVIDCKFNCKKLQLHTKVVLVTSAILIFAGALLFFGFEYNGVLKDMPWWQKIVVSIFQSVTTRTAGFTAVDLTAMTDSSTLLSICLMFIGGSPGSTAGGIKTTTFAVIIMGIIAMARNKKDIIIGERRLDHSTITQSMAIFASYLIISVVGMLTICALEPFSLKAVMLETISALGTVGLSEGITPMLTTVSKLIVAALMYTGRVGIFTLALSFSAKQKNPPISRPTDKILIG